MANTENAIQIAREFVKNWEGYYTDLGNGTVKAYWDKEGEKWTIGWGSTYYQDGSPVKQNDVITRQEADDLLMWELREKEQAIRNMIKVDVNDTQYAAMISLAYNCGQGNFGSSDLLKLINAKASTKDIVAQWKKTCVTAKGKYVQGLANRRIDESKLFEGSYNAVYSYYLRNAVEIKWIAGIAIVSIGLSIYAYHLLKKHK